jgi:hypothetical protein
MGNFVIAFVGKIYELTREIKMDDFIGIARIRHFKFLKYAQTTLPDDTFAFTAYTVCTGFGFVFV